MTPVEVLTTVRGAARAALARRLLRAFVPPGSGWNSSDYGKLLGLVEKLSDAEVILYHQMLDYQGEGRDR